MWCSMATAWLLFNMESSMHADADTVWLVSWEPMPDRIETLHKSAVTLSNEAAYPYWSCLCHGCKRA